MNSMNKLEKNVTKQFAEIFRKHTDPEEIRKRKNAEKRDKIKEEKLSSFIMYECI